MSLTSREFTAVSDILGAFVRIEKKNKNKKERNNLKYGIAFVHYIILYGEKMVDGSNHFFYVKKRKRKKRKKEKKKVWIRSKILDTLWGNMPKSHSFISSQWQWEKVYLDKETGAVWKSRWPSCAPPPPPPVPNKPVFCGCKATLKRDKTTYRIKQCT